MYKFLSRNGTSVAFGLGVSVSVITFIAIFSGLDKFYELPENDRPVTSIFNFGLSASIVLAVVAVLLMVGFGLYQILIHPKGGIRFLLGIVGIGLIGFLFYQYSTVETSGKVYQWMQQGILTPGVSKILNGALWAMIILSVLTLLSLFFAEIRNLFK